MSFKKAKKGFPRPWLLILLLLLLTLQDYLVNLLNLSKYVLYKLGFLTNNEIMSFGLSIGDFLMIINGVDKIISRLRGGLLVSTDTIKRFTITSYKWPDSSMTTEIPGIASSVKISSVFKSFYNISYMRYQGTSLTLTR